MRLLEPLALYHRLEVRGLENVPRGPALLVGNHNAGAAVVDMLFLTRYYQRFGIDQPVHILAHDFFFHWLPLGRFLAPFAILCASVSAARAALQAGHKVLVFPGSDVESMRPFSRRARVDLAGHRGFAHIAQDLGVPIVPVVSAGAHEGFVILSQGRTVARWLGINRRLHWHSFPVSLSLPWGLTVGPASYLPYLPLPAKVTVQIGPPLAPLLKEGPADLSRRTEETMQTMLDKLYGERRLPVLG